MKISLSKEGFLGTPINYFMLIHYLHIRILLAVSYTEFFFFFFLPTHNKIVCRILPRQMFITKSKGYIDLVRGPYAIWVQQTQCLS